LTADASAIVAAFAPWHEDHEAASERIGAVDDLVAHAELEAYSVLTRLPAPLRAPAGVVAEYLAQQFPGGRLVLPESARSGLTHQLAARAVIGGQVYDALIALTAAAHGKPVLTCDERALPIYRRLGVETELL
jgi:predicted nucleic acid-binding protein